MAELPAPPAGKQGWPWTVGDDPWPAATPRGGAWPALGIVTPSYNQAAFLEETLRSVLLQGCPRLAYVVIDGGSTDGSRAILERYAPYLAHWESEPDRGQSHAINKGFARCGGEIVGWINSDDALRPGALRAASEAFERHPRAGLVYGRASDRDEHGVPMNRFKGFPFTMEELLAGGNPVAQPSAFFRRSILERVGPLDESMHYAMDFDLWLRLAAAAEVVHEDAVWSDFRHYPTSKSGSVVLPFLIDIHAALERAFAGRSLPPELQAGERAALGRSLLRVAILSAWQGRDGEARAKAARAVRLRPALLLEAGSLAHLLRCWVGTPWTRRLKALGGRK